MSSQQTESRVIDETYKGFEYCIVEYSPNNIGSTERFFMGFDNATFDSWYLGYVIIPESHKYHGKHYDEIDINCHGDLTYADKIHWESKNKNKFAIGLDMNHSGDDGGTEEEMRQECKSIINQLTS